MRSSIVFFIALATVMISSAHASGDENNRSVSSPNGVAADQSSGQVKVKRQTGPGNSRGSRGAHAGHDGHSGRGGRGDSRGASRDFPIAAGRGPGRASGRGPGRADGRGPPGASPASNGRANHVDAKSGGTGGLGGLGGVGGLGDVTKVVGGIL